MTPADEVLRTMDGFVRAGKIRYRGISNAPAWWVAEVATLARAGGAAGPVALQYFYSLASREPEDELLPLARAFGMGLVPWSPLAYGLLTGKYRRDAARTSGPREGGLPTAAGADGPRPAADGRLDGANPFGDSLFTERNWATVDALRGVAGAAGEPMARVALAWVLGRPGVACALMGVSRVEQLTDNAAAAGLVLSPEHRAAPDAASAPEPRLLYAPSRPPMRARAVAGGATVTGWLD